MREAGKKSAPGRTAEKGSYDSYEPLFDTRTEQLKAEAGKKYHRGQQKKGLTESVKPFSTQKAQLK
jgi:hypothetical protein